MAGTRPRRRPGAGPDRGVRRVVNNADRKGGHLLRAADQHVYGIDHGVCFHAEDKLRTVLWGWAGTPLPAEETTGARPPADALWTGSLGVALAVAPDPA